MGFIFFTKFLRIGAEAGKGRGGVGVRWCAAFCGYSGGIAQLLLSLSLSLLSVHAHGERMVVSDFSLDCDVLAAWAWG